MQPRCNRFNRCGFIRYGLGLAAILLLAIPELLAQTAPSEKAASKKAASQQQAAKAQPQTGQQEPGQNGSQQRTDAPVAQRQTGLRSEAEIRTNTEVQKLLDEIEQHLRKLDWVATDIRQEVTLRGFNFTATGRYITGPNNLMRLEFRVKLADVEGELLEVCDGRDQWHVQSILDVKKVEHLNLEECNQILGDQDFDQEQRQAFMDARGLNGLAPFVSSLTEFFVFNQVEKKEWQGRNVIVARGTWNEARLGGNRGQRPEAEEDSEQPSAIPRGEEQERFSLLNLPPEMPTAITLWIDPEQKWIYRVEMVAERAPKNRPSRVVLEFNNPQFGKAFERNLFSYRPPDDIRPIDRTPVVVETLQVILQQVKNQKQQAGTREPAASGSTGGLLGPTRPQPSTNAPAQKKPEAKADQQKDNP